MTIISSDEIQLRQGSSLTYCFLTNYANKGQLMYKCEVVRFDPVAEENIPVETKVLTVAEFAEWYAKESWHVA